MIKDIIEQAKDLQVSERTNTNGYAELIIQNEEIDQWLAILTENLGEAIKPKGTKPTLEDVSITEEFGGIHDQQTLFKHEGEQSYLLAMLWPWQDKVNITLKLAVVHKK